MPEILNPFDSSGFGVGFMTGAINEIPNLYGRINELGLFNGGGGITTLSVIIAKESTTINLLPSVPRGGPASKANRTTRNMRAFVVPHIPHDDEFLPEDIQSILAPGMGPMAAMNQLATPEAVILRRLERMRVKHGQTLEYMRMSALKGQLKDGSGNMLYDWNAEFGFTKMSFDFDLGTPTTLVTQKITAVTRYLEDNLRGETMNGVLALVSGEFFDKLTGHPTVRAAYQNFSNAPGDQNILRNDMRRRFVFGGIAFEEYRAVFTLADQVTVERGVPAGEGIAFPLGTTDTFQTFFAPANRIDTVNTVGLETYAWQATRSDLRAIDLFTESNPLPLVRRPQLIVRLWSST